MAKIDRLYTFSAPGVDSLSLEVARLRLRWLTDRHVRGRTVVWRRMPRDMPVGAATERELARRAGVKSVLSIPMIAGSKLFVMAFTSTRRYYPWTDAAIARMHVVVEILASAVLRYRAEQSLQQSEARFRGAFDHSAIGIALVSPDGRWLRVNAALCGILGYTEEELLATTFQSLTLPEDLPTNLGYLQRAVAGEISYYELEKRYIHKQGHIVWALLTVSLVRDADGSPLYFVSQVQDLTERKQSQIENERMRLELAHVGRLALLGQLTASLAHEVLQPITSILGNAEAGLRLCDSSGRVPQEMNAILRDVIDSSKRAGEIIAAVRGLLRKERRPRHPVNLNRIVRQVAEVMHSELILRRVRLVMHLDSRVPEVTADPVELQQVVLNLLLNGAEAMNRNEASHGTIVISTSAGRGQIELSVCDSGPGVAEAHLGRMFEPFFTTKPDGIGMGLPICSEIIRSHGGRLWAERNAGVGMTLRCLLPLGR
jgi:PAS domain S-box-containing protein